MISYELFPEVSHIECQLLPFVSVKNDPIQLDRFHAYAITIEKIVMMSIMSDNIYLKIYKLEAYIEK